MLVTGYLDIPEQEKELHTVSVVGFRSPALFQPSKGELKLADENVNVLYVHDDNLGPNARFHIEEDDQGVILVPDAPHREKESGRRTTRRRAIFAWSRLS